MRLRKGQDAGEVSLAELKNVIADGHEPSECLQCPYRRGSEGPSDPSGGCVVSKPQGLHALLGPGMEPDLTTVGHDREDAGDVETALLPWREAAFKVPETQHGADSVRGRLRVAFNVRGESESGVEEDTQVTPDVGRCNGAGTKHEPLCQ